MQIYKGTIDGFGVIKTFHIPWKIDREQTTRTEYKITFLKSLRRLNIIPDKKKSKGLVYCKNVHQSLWKENIVRLACGKSVSLYHYFNKNYKSIPSVHVHMTIFLDK